MSQSSDARRLSLSDWIPVRDAMYEVLVHQGEDPELASDIAAAVAADRQPRDGGG